MGVTLYSHTDVGAPQLTGEVGKVITVLDACLVNGYGSKVAAGWTKPFSGTNKGVYRSPAGNRLFLRILNDNATTDTIGGSNVGICRAVGYETMSDVDTGTGSFPTAVQLAGGLIMHTTYDRTATVRPWWLIADEKMFYFIPSYDSSACFGFCFGTFQSFIQNDNYNTIIIATSTVARDTHLPYNSPAGSCNVSGQYTARRWDNLSISTNSSKLNLSGLGISSVHSGMSQAFTYPNPITGGLIISPQYIQEIVLGTVIRGRLPGFWFLCQTVTFGTGDIIQGSPGTELEGKSFMFFKQYNNNGYFIEISDTWYNIGF